MKTMIYSLTLAALMITSFSSCSDDNDPVFNSEKTGTEPPLILLRQMP